MLTGEALRRASAILAANGPWFQGGSWAEESTGVRRYPLPGRKINPIIERNRVLCWNSGTHAAGWLLRLGRLALTQDRRHDYSPPEKPVELFSVEIGGSRLNDSLAAR